MYYVLTTLYLANNPTRYLDLADQLKWERMHFSERPIWCASPLSSHKLNRVFKQLHAEVLDGIKANNISLYLSNSISSLTFSLEQYVSLEWP